MTLIKKPLDRVQLTDTQIKVIMPKKVLDQIKYLCRNISEVEWSGVLYYNIEGSIKNPENLVLTLEEILPLHKGTSGYTEYEFGEAFVEHMMENEHLDNCKMGHIHSHNNMAVFFSGTDWSELEDNAPNHNFYLSLIVNNRMDFQAKVCFIAETKDIKKYEFIAKDENGLVYKYSEQDYAVPTKKLVVYDCEIICPDNVINITDQFKTKVETIIENAEKRAKVAAMKYNPGVGFSNTNNAAISQGQTWTRPKGGNYWPNKNDKKPLATTPPTQRKNVTSITDEIVTDEIFLDEIIEQFVLDVLYTKNSGGQFLTILDVVNHYRNFYVNGVQIAKGVLDNYLKLYKDFFKTANDVEDATAFEIVTEQVIGALEDERDCSTARDIESMLNPTIEGLRLMLNNFKRGI